MKIHSEMLMSDSTVLETNGNVMEGVSLICPDARAKMPRSSGYRPGIPQHPYTKWDTEKDEVEVDYKTMEDDGQRSCFSGRKGMVLRILLILVIFLLGLIVGYILRRSFSQIVPVPKTKCPFRNGNPDYSTDTSQILQNRISAKQLEEKSKNYTKNVHISGTHDNNLLGRLLEEEMRSYGIKKILKPKYNVLLSYQQWETPSVVSILDENNTVKLQTNYTGPPHDYHPELKEAYNAYSPNGTVLGKLLFANYGEESDFETLKLKYHIENCSDTIVIMKYGRIFRGDKVLNAAACGANGVLLYCDPADFVDQHNVTYPESKYLPGWAVSRGSVLASEGDPLTPGLPSSEGMYRIPLSQAKLAPIPSLPISYNDAAKLMKNMGNVIDKTWTGAMTGVKYNIGPGYSGNRKDWRVKLDVYTELERRNVTNILGVIKGTVEPDRYIIVGCHYDAWTYGAVDPNSGTAILMELVEAFNKLLRLDWMPRRTIIFAHWDGEEMGLTGSYEWVEEHEHIVRERTVAYINLDSAVQGNYVLSPTSDPLLLELLVNVTVNRPSFSNPDRSEYDMWKERSPDIHKPPNKVRVSTTGSDHAPFVHRTGVPVMGIRYNSQKSGFPGYHTIIDDFKTMSEFIDPGFKAHEMVAKITSDIVIRLTDSAKLPFRVQALAQYILDGFSELNDSLKNSGKFHPVQEYMMHLDKAVNRFSNSAVEFDETFIRMDEERVMDIRCMNDRIMQLPRAFLYPEGIPGNPHKRNILYAEGTIGNNQVFGAVHKAARGEEYNPSSINWPLLQKQISLATLAVQSAVRIVSDVGEDVRW